MRRTSGAWAPEEAIAAGSSHRAENNYITLNVQLRSSIRAEIADYIAMPREAEQSLNERTFISEALQQNTRLDGRSLDTYRPIQISFGDGYGAADVRIGDTRCANLRIAAKRTYSLTCYLTEFSPASPPL